jgi:class 3 adenylate cyclase/tetratricopeptide (TPR) repeat protein
MQSRCPQCNASVELDALCCSACGSVSASERREAVVMFCDLGGYTAWNEEDEPEEVATTIDLIKRRSIDILAAHGGIANQFVGDEVLGLFGVIATHEDDPCRAVAAARALHAYVRTLEAYRPSGEARLLRMHTGIEVGTVYSRVRDPRAGLYDVTGDPVNTAARLRSIAEPDEIVVGAAMYARVAPFFRLEAQAPVTMRGKLHPTLSYRVLGPASSSSFFDAARARGLTSYVNHEAELGTLQRAFRQACDGRGQLVTIGGAAGVGKTRLLHEFRKRVASSPQPVAPLIMHGCCLAYGEVAPYQPFIDALRRTLAVAGEQSAGEPVTSVERLQDFDRDLEPYLPVFSYLLSARDPRYALPSSTAGEPLRDAIVDALSQLVCLIARSRPVLLVFEDWHWADEASNAALRVMAKNVATQRVLVVVNFRDTELLAATRPKANIEIALEPLGPSDTAAVARGALSSLELPVAISGFIYQRTLGNPLFVEEVCRSLVDKGAFAEGVNTIGVTETVQQLATPVTIQAIVRARVDRLHARPRRVLRVASVVGNEFTLSLLAGLLSSDGVAASSGAIELSEILQELETQGLVYAISSVAEPIYRFKHAITQEVVYEGLTLHERRRYHGELAEAIEHATEAGGREAQYEQLAHHYGLSSRRDKAIDYTLRAADKAWHAFSVRQAARLYRRAIELLDGIRPLAAAQSKLRVDVTLSWARVGLYNPDLQLVEALRGSYAHANELADARAACLCLNWMGWILHALGLQNESEAQNQRCLEAAKDLGDDTLVAQALTNIGLNYAMATRYDEALEYIRRGIAVRKRQTGTAYGYSLGQMALIAGDQGDFPRGYALLEKSLSDSLTTESLTMQGPLLIQRAMLECWQGEFVLCCQTARAALHIAERIDGRYIHAMSQTLEGYARFALEQDVGALELAEHSVSFFEQTGMGHTLSWSLSLLADALCGEGRFEIALQFAHKALERGASWDRLGEANAQRVCGLVAARAHGDFTRAHVHLERARELSLEKRSTRELAQSRCTLGDILLMQGRTAEASEVLDKALLSFRSMGMEFHAQRVRQLLEPLRT